MKLKNLFYLLVAMTLVFAACEKGTDDTDKKPDTEQPGDENPGDENPGDDQPGDEPEDKEPILTLTSEAVMEFTAEGGTGEILYTLENVKEGVNVTATCEATWVTDIAVAEKVTFAVAANEGEAREAVVVVAYDTKKFEVAVKQTAKEVVDDTVSVVSAVATEGTSNGDMNYHSVAFKLSNNDTIAIEFRTDDNNYLTLGEYTDSWSDYAGNGGTIPGYVNYAFKNGESIG
ncbi:MAG: BACON domain-containing protein [Alistipes sp.]|nr:BACON domain-containing protein [Alistipes sp.]